MDEAVPHISAESDAIEVDHLGRHELRCAEEDFQLFRWIVFSG